MTSLFLRITANVLQIADGHADQSTDGIASVELRQSLLDLPIEIIVQIFRSLEIIYRPNLALTCKRLARIGSSINVLSVSFFHDRYMTGISTRDFNTIKWGAIHWSRWPCDVYSTQTVRFQYCVDLPKFTISSSRERQITLGGKVHDKTVRRLVRELQKKRLRISRQILMKLVACQLLCWFLDMDRVSMSLHISRNSSWLTFDDQRVLAAGIQRLVSEQIQKRQDKKDGRIIRGWWKLQNSVRSILLRL